MGRGPLVVRIEGALPGYTLFAPLDFNDTLLVDMDGRVVHKWTSQFPPGQSVHFLENGHLLRCAREPGDSVFHSGGEGGRLEEFDWDGNLVWTYVHSDKDHRQHHDVEPMKNGHVLVISWETKSREDAITAGRDAVAAAHGLWPDSVVEIEPVRPAGGKVVWEWHVWDHLVQDRDRRMSNFGVVAEHPELVDINANRPDPKAKPQEMSDEAVKRMRSIGYLGGDDDRGKGPRRGGPMENDWNHINSIAYNADLDQILLSSHNQNEIWIIDHSTTTKEAASHAGGRYGRGGDLLYRWGNPATYHAGTREEQKLYGQHDAHWIEKGRAGEGHILIFNNGAREGFGPAPGGERRESFSTVVEIAPPLTSIGNYLLEKGKAFGPAEPVWTYSDHASQPPFFAELVSSAERLGNRNTLICSGTQNRIFEVTPDGKVVWDFRNPYGVSERGHDGRAPGPPPGGGGGPPPGGPGAGPGRGPGGPHPGIFRAIRIAIDHPALKGKALIPIEIPAAKKFE
ncbi:MAG: aryl-sulfate sulfotransferase [Planctomycetes bacterium]|nr:aryl-sulfate sulfotransferase [Planctomycetota bacterium]